MADPAWLPLAKDRALSRLLAAPFPPSKENGGLAELQELRRDVHEMLAGRPIEVVCGALFSSSGDHILMNRRATSPGVQRPGMWELPGGKVERLESPALALEREWREDLKLEVSCREQIVASVPIALDVDIDISLYRVDLVRKFPGDEPLTALSAFAVKFVRPALAVREMACTPGFYAHFAGLREYMRATGRWSS